MKNKMITILLFSTSIILGDVVTGLERYFRYSRDPDLPYQSTWEIKIKSYTNDTLLYSTVFLSDTLLTVGDTFCAKMIARNHDKPFSAKVELRFENFTRCTFDMLSEDMSYDGLLPTDSTIILFFSGIVRIPKTVYLTAQVTKTGEDISKQFYNQYGSVTLNPSEIIGEKEQEAACKRMFALDAIRDYNFGVKSLADTYRQVAKWAPVINWSESAEYLAKYGFSLEDADCCEQYIYDVTQVLRRNLIEDSTSKPSKGGIVTVGRLKPKFSKADSLVVGEKAP